MESAILVWMLTKKITSLQHSLVKHWVRLRSERAYREETQRVLVSGEKMVGELACEVLITVEERAEADYVVTEEIMKKITGLEQPDGVAAEIKRPKPENMQGKSHILILDRLTDPGNLGTLLRTALALGWEGVIVTPGTVDLFNDKALRAAKGATFRLPYAEMTHEEIAQLPIRFLTADLGGKEVGKAPTQPPIGLILSNESEGPSSWAEKIGETVTIPMKGPMESLNVATSGAILLYVLRNG